MVVDGVMNAVGDVMERDAYHTWYNHNFMISWRIIVGSAISMEIFTRQQLLLQREASVPRPAVLRRDYNRTARYPHNYYSWNGPYLAPTPTTLNQFLIVSIRLTFFWI